MKRKILKSLWIGALCGLCWLGAQVATYTTLAQIPAVSAGGTLNLFSDFIGLAFNSDSAGTRKWIGPSFALSKPPLTGWTNDNGGTFDTTYGYPFFVGPNLSGTTNIEMEYRTAPATPYSCIALIYHAAGYSGGNGDTGFGVGFRDGSGKITSYTAYASGSTGLYVDNWTTSTSFSSTPGVYAGSNAPLFEFVQRNPKWFKWTDDGVNLIFQESIDGNHWTTPSGAGFSVSRTSWFASGPTQVGLILKPVSASMQIGVPSWNCQ